MLALVILAILDIDVSISGDGKLVRGALCLLDSAGAGSVDDTLFGDDTVFRSGFRLRHGLILDPRLRWCKHRSHFP